MLKMLNAPQNTDEVKAKKNIYFKNLLLQKI